MMNDEITRTLKKYGRADVPTYLKEITFLRGLLAEAYKELSTIEAATLIPGGQDEIDGLLDLVRRIKAEVDGVRQEAAVDGPIYEAGRLEGHADIAARLRAILDPEDENHWNIDGVIEAVEDNAKMLEAMRKELNALCDWGDDSFLHAYCHIGNVIKNLRADVRTEKILREKAEANYAFMVKKAADQNLDGYRELGARAASAENEADRLRARLRETAQILIEAVGAGGPMDAEDAARKASERIDTLRSIADEKSHEAGLYARRMEQAQKARGGIRSRLVGEGWVGPDKWSYCPYCGVEAPRPGRHKQGCPAHDKGGSR